jgi:hypothetical protein
VAEVSPGEGDYAIFANDPDCGNDHTLQISGSTTFVSGKVHSNGYLKVSGSDNDFDGETTYTCGLDVPGQNNDFTPPPEYSDGKELPVNYAFNDFPCDITFPCDTDLRSHPEVWMNNDPNTNALKNGVYCSLGKLALSGSDVTGTVTLAAQGMVNLNGSNFHVTGLWNDVLLYSSDASDCALDVIGSGGVWVGIFLAPNGLARFRALATTPLWVALSRTRPMCRAARCASRALWGTRVLAGFGWWSDRSHLVREEKTKTQTSGRLRALGRRQG